MARITEADRAGIIALYGMLSAEKVAEKYGCSRSAVLWHWWKWRQKNNVTPIPTRISWDRIERITEAYTIPDDPIVDHGKLLIELKENDCRWPIGVDTDKQFRFCASGKMRPSFGKLTACYCETHVDMACDGRSVADLKNFKKSSRRYPWKVPVHYGGKGVDVAAEFLEVA